MFFVYLVTNLLNGKLYVGKTYDVRARWAEHKMIANGGKTTYPTMYQYLHKAISKYGSESFQVSTLGSYELEEESFANEIKLIKQFKSDGFKLYNLTDGGEGRSGPRPKASDETKLKCSLASSGKNNAFYGKKHTAEAKEKISTYRKDNIDKISGENAPSAKLTWVKVRKIRKLLSTGTSQVALAKQYGITRQSVWSIDHNLSWIE
jgi:group I intron endonuclease